MCADVDQVTWAAGSSSAVILVVNDPAAAPAYLGLQGHVGLAHSGALRDTQAHLKQTRADSMPCRVSVVHGPLGNDSTANWLATWFVG